jgi:DNA-binding MarR family transcriptional regulator
MITKSKEAHDAIGHLSRSFSGSRDETGAIGPGHENLMSEMGRIMYAFHRSFQSIMGISGAQWRMISLIANEQQLTEQDIHAKLEEEVNKLARQKGISQRKIQELLGVDAAGITRVAKQLQQDGLIRREVDPQDNRFTLIYLTEEGRRLYDEIEYKVAGLWERAFSDVDRDDVTRMRATLHHIADNLSAIADEVEKEEL